MAVVNAAIGRSVIDPDDFARQIRPRLQDAQAAWGEVAASRPAPMTTPAPPSLAGVEASAQLHQALHEITRKGNGWARPVQIAERSHLDGAAVGCSAMPSQQRAVVPNGSPSCRLNWPAPDTSTPRPDFSRPWNVTPAVAGMTPKVRCAPQT
jgi:hypothetical protein